MTTDKRSSDAEMRARALSRWEGEGGALIPTGAADSIDESELRILARLGAAMLDEWAEMPSALQHAVVRRAATLGAAGDLMRIRAKLALFLQEHRDHC